MDVSCLQTEDGYSIFGVMEQETVVMMNSPAIAAAPAEIESVKFVVQQVQDYCTLHLSCPPEAISDRPRGDGPKELPW